MPQSRIMFSLFFGSLSSIKSNWCYSGLPNWSQIPYFSSHDEIQHHASDSGKVLGKNLNCHCTINLLY